MGNNNNLGTRKFKVINEGFSCNNCGKKVPPASLSCRNHCPHCLFSKHVDFNPGDRQNRCQALMKPIGYRKSGKKGLVLFFKCLGCGAESQNIAALDCKHEADDYELILSLGAY